MGETDEVADTARFLTEAIEINAVWHCNLACVGCSHASPDAPRYFASVEQVTADAVALAKWVEVDHIRVLGGEPMLHPKLPDLVNGLRSSGLSRTVRVITNGLTLTQAPGEFWDCVDEVHVSSYPSTRKFLKRSHEQLRSLARETNTTVVVKEFENFRTTRRAPSADWGLTMRVYQTCQVGRLWRCLTLHDGRIYRCPQSLFTPARVPAEEGHDFLTISTISRSQEVADWVDSLVPPRACSECAGSAGVLIPHHQIRRRHREDTDGLDPNVLTELDNKLWTDVGCVSHETVLWVRS